jgi:DNA-binding NarL/FixJ family response regulator
VITTRILLADDHAMLRAGVRALLNEVPGASVVGEAGDGRELLGLIQTTHPDVVMLDISMPGLNGLEALDHIHREFPTVRCVILSMHANEEYVLKAIRSGAAGYLLKNSRPAELQQALESVRAGETYLSPAVARHVAEYLQRHGEGDDPLAQLTPRQREILQLIAEGQSTKEMAATLGISGKTVDMHRAQLMERLQIHDVAGLVRYAIRAGLVDPEH